MSVRGLVKKDKVALQHGGAARSREGQWRAVVRPQSMEMAPVQSRLCYESLVVDRTRLGVAGGRSVGIASLETLYISCGAVVAVRG